MSIFDRPKPEPIRVFVNGKDVTPEPPVEQVCIVTVEPIPMKVLPPYDADGRCPKCRFDALTTIHQSGAHDGCLGIRYPRMSFGIGLGEEYYARFQAQRDAIPEHLDRKCVRCGFEWAEALAA